jgi:hypothetical protein
MDMKSSVIDTRVVEWQDLDNQEKNHLYLHLTDEFPSVRNTVVALRKHHIPSGWEDKFDLHSYHLLAYQNDTAIACLRLTSAQDHPVPNVQFYSARALNVIAPYYSSMSRFYMLPSARLPIRVMVSMLQRAGELALTLGSALDVSNCALRAISYYKRRGCIIDKKHTFIHPTDETENCPAYLPACPNNPSFISPVMHLAQRHYDSRILRRCLRINENPMPTTNQAASPWFSLNLAVPGVTNEFVTCRDVSAELLPFNA